MWFDRHGERIAWHDFIDYMRAPFPSPIMDFGNGTSPETIPIAPWSFYLYDLDGDGIPEETLTPIWHIAALENHAMANIMRMHGIE